MLELLYKDAKKYVYELSKYGVMRDNELQKAILHNKLREL